MSDYPSFANLAFRISGRTSEEGAGLLQRAAVLAIWRCVYIKQSSVNICY